MITTLKRLGIHVFFLLLLGWPLYSAAGMDGKYEGEYAGNKVSMVLETATTTMTGVLGIGDESYLLRAESNDGSISGQLTSITSGESQKLTIKPKGDAIDVEVTPKGGEVMHFTLRRTK